MLNTRKRIQASSDAPAESVLESKARGPPTKDRLNHSMKPSPRNTGDQSQRGPRLNDVPSTIEVRIPIPLESESNFRKWRSQESSPSKRRRHNTSFDTPSVSPGRHPNAIRRFRSFTPAFPGQYKYGYPRAWSTKHRQQPVRDAKVYPTIENTAADTLPTPDASSDAFPSSTDATKNPRRRPSKPLRPARRAEDAEPDYIPSRNVTVNPSQLLDEPHPRAAGQSIRRPLITPSNSSSLHYRPNAELEQAPCDIKLENTVDGTLMKPRSRSVLLDSPSKKRVQQYERDGFVEISKFENALHNVCHESKDEDINRNSAHRWKRRRKADPGQVSLEAKDTNEVKVEYDSKLSDLLKSPLCESDLKGMHPERARKFLEETEQSINSLSNANPETPYNEKPSDCESPSNRLEASAAHPVEAATSELQAKPDNDCAQQQALEARPKYRKEGKHSRRRASCKKHDRVNGSIKKSLRRREVDIPSSCSSEDVCKCVALPEYFKHCQDGVEHSKSGLALPEFEMGCEQVVDCGVHSRSTIKSCKCFLREQRETSKSTAAETSAEEAIAFASEFLGSYTVPLHPRARHKSKSDKRLDRALSSIPPPRFYDRELQNTPAHERDHGLDSSRASDILPENDGWQPMDTDDSHVGIPVDSNLASQIPLAIRSKSPAAAKITDRTSITLLASTETSAASHGGNQLEVSGPHPQEVPSNTRRVRSKTVPADVRHQKKRASNDKVGIFAGENCHSPTLRELASHQGFDKKKLRDLEKVFKSVLDSYNINPRPSTTQRIDPTHTPPLQPTATSSAQTDRPNQSNAQRTHRRSGHKPVAEREILHPRLPPNIPPEGPLPESEIIRIGKIINPYERHRAAPYAFSYWGRVYKRWKYLAQKRGDDGELVWDMAVVNRVNR